MSALNGRHGYNAAMGNVTVMLHQWRTGDTASRAAVFEILSENLVGIAQRELARQGRVTLQPSDLVNETIVRMLGKEPTYTDRTHLMAIASLKVRSVLLDHIRHRKASKRGGEDVRVNLTVALNEMADAPADVDAFALNQALDALAEVDRRAADAIEMAYFGGMERKEIAESLDVSLPTVDRDLAFARAWLNRHLGN